MVEEGGARILIDPSGHDASNFVSFGRPDVVIYTHEHMDHFNPDLAQKFADSGVPIYANASTAKLMKSQPNIVADGQEFDVKGVKISVHELPHCLMANGSPGPQNSGYLIANRLFHPGDGKELADLKAEILAAPIAGPDISFKDAFDFAEQVSAKTVVPVHYDFIGAKPEVFDVLCGDQKPFEVKIIAPGQSIEIWFFSYT